MTNEKVVDPQNLDELTLQIKTDEPSAYDSFLEWFGKAARLIYITFEFLLGLAIYLILLWNCWKIFVINDATYICHAKSFIEFINHNWIGFLFVPPLIFFRLIIVKLERLKDAKGVSFSEGSTLYTTEK